MALTINFLLENHRAAEANNGLTAKNGLSLLLSDEHNIVLFDTGPDGTFKSNAAAMGISLDNLTAVVLSHGHYDHCGGVPWLADNTRIVCHPDVGQERHAAIRVPGRVQKIKRLSVDVDYSRFAMEYSRKPLKIGERFMWSGEIGGGNSPPYGILGDARATPDYLDDEGALIYMADEGLVIFTGCGHHGVINIVRHCQKITGISRVHALIGGFHLRSASPRTLWQVRKYLLELQPASIIACHCTGRWGRLWLPECIYPATGATLVLR